MGVTMYNKIHYNMYMYIRCIYEYHYEYTDVFEYINTSVVTRKVTMNIYTPTT